MISARSGTQCIICIYITSSLASYTAIDFILYPDLRALGDFGINLSLVRGAKGIMSFKEQQKALGDGATLFLLGDVKGEEL